MIGNSQQYSLLFLAVVTILFIFSLNKNYIGSERSQMWVFNLNENKLSASSRHVFNESENEKEVKLAEYMRNMQAFSSPNFESLNSITNKSYYNILPPSEVSPSPSSTPSPPSLIPPAILLGLKGGIGNQLFEYACHYALARKHDLPLYIKLNAALRAKLNLVVSHDPNATTPTPIRPLSVTDRSVALSAFKIPLFPWNTIDETFTIPRHRNIADSAILAGSYSTNGTVLWGSDYCQSEFYFSPYRDEIREIFKFRGDAFLSDEARAWDDIISQEGTTIGIHVRRGDFIRINATIPISYYTGALSALFEKLGEPENISLFVFSDDLNYANQTFVPYLSNFSDFSNQDIYIVSDPTRLTSLEEFYLLSKCQHFIIPNSSFSWWAAYLGGGKEKIVYAAHFREDFIKTLYPGGGERQTYYVWQYRYIYYPSGWNAVEPDWAEPEVI
ncbi:O-antigen biosynthesis glycosyltransferase WbnK-like [Folsomia candida]|uniref:L-Fucosyltransferase n=1 Tax=Folsomia candida TaxID=158441 RepID=A0A226E881_FOLCA|nr:O-antigen biosynthesis glycosyltransferase WbnK-like [Folsomia candida]OXA53518.1 O-antigen biosynthesis glycosyltransferase WbnK [Folsomia candida]